MITYDDSNISYGCIEYLRKRIQQNCKPKKAEYKIILATLFKFHTQNLIELKEEKIIFHKTNTSEIEKLEENEKLIYRFIRSISQNNELIIEDFINPSKQLYIEYRDGFIDLNESIENDLNDYNYYEKRIFKLGKKKVNKRLKNYMDSFEEYLKITNGIISEDIREIEFEQIKICAKISVITGLSKKFLIGVERLDFEHKNEFIKYMQNYLKIVQQLRENMNNKEEIIQSELKSRHITSVEAYKGARK